jgi:hypothetical protein
MLHALQVHLEGMLQEEGLTELGISGSVTLTLNGVSIGAADSSGIPRAQYLAELLMPKYFEDRGHKNRTRERIYQALTDDGIDPEQTLISTFLEENTYTDMIRRPRVGTVGLTALNDALVLTGYQPFRHS